MKERIPQTDSIRELAEFWDTHDVTDFEDELEEVTEPVFERGAVFRLHLAPKEAAAVGEIAKDKGVAPDDLIREWVEEKLRAA
ncbi:MAG: BrnA antitoxin family protein [Acidobacteriota bacterium]|nr:BrnA antitoxin family protein [Acidobacteriota bacterium]